MEIDRTDIKRAVDAPLEDPLAGLEITAPAQVVQPAITPTRAQNFPEWFQSVVRAADLAENSLVRGCMVLKPDGYAIWEQIQQQFDPMLKSVGVKNAAFPLFIPLEFFQREAKHAEGFATEVAVVTHRRLEKNAQGILVPSAPLEEPLVVRPTSEMIIGDSMSRWIKSHRDMPMKLNQWCSVVRMEMRPRIFLRTTEFWWHEGHSAHSSAGEAQEHTIKMFDLYNKFITENLAIPVIPGEKIPSERFAGADRTFSLESIMQDGKALQAATSHYLGQNFAKAMNIQFQSAQGAREFAHTTSWGMSTRIIGAMIMVHSDDDGLRLPPRIAPQQVVIVPVCPRNSVEGEVLEYCNRVKEALGAISYHGRSISVVVDDRDLRGSDKRWEAIKKGVPIIIEAGPREVASNSLAVSRRDLQAGTKISVPLEQFVNDITKIFDHQQQFYLAEANRFLSRHIRTDIKTLDELREIFAPSQDGASTERCLVRAKWCGDESTLAVLKDLKLTVRCIPFDQDETEGPCILTQRPSNLDVIFGVAY